MPHIPEFPVQLGGFRDLHAPFLNERRTSGRVRGILQEIRGISPSSGEMWEAQRPIPESPEGSNNPQNQANGFRGIGVAATCATGAALTGSAAGVELASLDELVLLPAAAASESELTAGAVSEVEPEFPAATVETQVDT